jgi:predicted RNase H-like nuclease
MAIPLGAGTGQRCDHGAMRVLGVDLAWGEGNATKAANETGVVALDVNGNVLDAGWTIGSAATADWIHGCAGDEALLFIDAPLIVDNATGQRLCETEVGRRYWPWKVSANSTNLGSRNLAGVALRKALETHGWRYDDGRDGPPPGGRVMSECYPYTTIVGVAELGFDVERPRYKRQPKGMTTAQSRPLRAAACDQLITALAGLEDADPPLNLRSHETTALLLDESSPLSSRAYKHREDLVDAVICAWTGLLWLRHGHGRCQVLGLTDDPSPTASIIAPCRPEQRRPD